MIKTSLTLAFLLVSLTPLAQARDTVLNLPLADVLSMPEAQGKLDGSVKFFLAGQPTPKVLKRLVSDETSQKTNSFNKSDEFACKWAALSALIHLQAVAKQQGGNAVVDIVSDYKFRETKSSTTFECHAGALIAGVALKGSIVQIGQ